MRLGHYVALIDWAERALGDAFVAVADAHAEEHEVRRTSLRFARECEQTAGQLEPFRSRYTADVGASSPPLPGQRFGGPRPGPLGLLRDLHELAVMVAECEVGWTVLAQGASGARDRELLDVCERCRSATAIQGKWLETQLRQAAPQALVVTR